MATRSPTPYHPDWGIFALVADLPNVFGSPTQKPNLQVGDLATVGTTKYVCTLATVGAAIWTPLGGSPSIEEISGLSNARHYRFGSDPTSAAVAFTACVLVRGAIDAASAAPRYPIGTYNGAGGWGLRWTNFGGTGDTLLTFEAIITDNAGTPANFGVSNTLNAQKMILGVLVFNGNSFGNTVATLFINGAYASDVFVGGVSGAGTAGGNLTIGATNQGGTGEGLGPGWLHGAAYVTRALTFQEVVDLTEATLSSLELANIGGGGWTNGWRVSGGDPGAAWAPFVGATSLTRFGTAATYSVRDNPAVY
ncbi:MAG: hypothetical protein HC882_00275 [Acidobacteria bacterium]|nr:hypothetical protein [Acidobacteriota bacterium]